MTGFYVYRLRCGSAVLVGLLDERGTSFSYDAEYLGMPGATPLSLSLPLRLEEFSEGEIRPYFEGLLAEGRARAALASELGLAEEDWLGMLIACGRECIGDVLVLERPVERPLDVGSYESLDEDALRRMFLNDRAWRERTLRRASRSRGRSQRRRLRMTIVLRRAGAGYVPLACLRARTFSRRATCAICRRSSFSACPPQGGAG